MKNLTYPTSIQFLNLWIIKTKKANFDEPSLEILKKDDPSFIISFLYKEFKVQGINIVYENNLEYNLKFLD